MERHGQIRRHPNYIWDQLAEDRLTASLIADGHHLPPAVLKTFVRGKTPERCILVSDVTGMAGLPPGRYENSALGDVEVLEDGRLVVAGQRQYLAGAALPIGVGIVSMMRSAGLSMGEAVAMASMRPTELLGESASSLEVGATANVVSFELPKDESGQLRVLGTALHGEVVHGEFQSEA